MKGGYPFRYIANIKCRVGGLQTCHTAMAGGRTLLIGHVLNRAGKIGLNKTLPQAWSPPLRQEYCRTGGPVPVVFGVITCDTLEQAIERSGTKAGNKGYSAAEAALEMADVFAQIAK